MLGSTYRALSGRKCKGDFNLRPLVVKIRYLRAHLSGALSGTSLGGMMRKPRPNSYNPAQALHLITSDRQGAALSCPSCSGKIKRDPNKAPPPPLSHVTLTCTNCGRFARYIAGAA